MIMDNIMGGMELVAIVLVFLLGIMVVVYVPVGEYTRQVCAEYGYPGSTVTINLSKYCIRVVEQTEYICLLDDVRNGECGVMR